jgi:hypothetical protein
MGKMVGAGAGAGIFDKLEPDPHKNGTAPQRWLTRVNCYVRIQTRKLKKPISHLTTSTKLLKLCVKKKQNFS